MCETNPNARQSSGPQATRSESLGRIKVYIGKDTKGDAQITGIELRVVVKLAEAKKGFVLLPRRWLVERSFGWLARFRRQSRDFERMPHVLAALHYLIFVTLMLPKAVVFGAAVQSA